MPIHLRENQYRGVNAHLHSLFQANEAEWEPFHSQHIVHLREAIQERLPDGYFAQSEQSLQVHQNDADGERIDTRRSIPDVTIYQSQTQRQPYNPSVASTPILELPIIETFEEPRFFAAIVIYRPKDARDWGKPVTRIELLSVGNKPGGSHHSAYITNREQTLRGQVNLVEIDYLHRFRPIVRALPSYIDREPNAVPYYVLISKPIPDLKTGTSKYFGSFVDEPLPTIQIPLLSKESIDLELDAVYQHTFNINRGFGLLLVDYAKPPVEFHTYSPDDQDRIRMRMAAVQEAQKESDG